jgi:hypothetical protein
LDGNPLSKLYEYDKHIYSRPGASSLINYLFLITKLKLDTFNSTSIMVVVAIAGGSGNLGRALVDALKAKDGAKIIILARKVSPSGVVYS